ncbi:peptidylprolyl isomerase [Candidatus Anaplasma sp. TIGMIC]|uniref:peptidylprolyl isomerase n=1 Tax=Candidatus Anaplasma sp. TIGMIC TaxID=3020713 RepID=UPI00232F5F55|nr:peptidylprolyl isomerase [Candidatus Anaplasma sp. TIGMIC]MDB1135698.1 SurA N-terminal domain-containing protein [Candidatus Anaplasma sp. TIGMIC]
MQSRNIYVGAVLAVILAAVAFVTFSGVLPLGGASKRDDNRLCVAELGERCISLRDYNIAYQAELEGIEKVIRQKLTDHQVKQLGIKETLLKDMVSEMLVEKLSHDVGIRIGAKSVRSLIRSIKDFQDKDGVFDKDLFERILEVNGMSEASYTGKIRNALPSTMLLECLFPSGGDLRSKYHEDLAKDIFDGKLQYRVADIVEVSQNAIAGLDEVDVPEDALHSMYESEKDRFLFPEYRSSNYLIVTEDDALESVTASDNEVEIEIKNSRLDDQRDVLNLVFTSKEEADTFNEELRTGKTFEELITNMGVSADDITLNNISREILPVDARGVVFGLAAGEVSDVFRSVVGWHIMKVLSRHSISSEDLAQLKDKISLNIRKQKAAEVLAANVKKANDMISQGASLEEVAGLFRAPSRGLLEGFDMHGLKSDGTPVEFPETLGGNAFTTLVFSSPSDKPSHFVDVGDAYFSVMVTEIIPPKEKTFEESVPALTEEWKSSLRMSKMRELASELSMKLQNGGEIQFADGINVRKDTVIRKTGKPGENHGQYPEGLVDLVFSMKVGDVSKVVTDSEKIYFAALKEVKSADIPSKELQEFTNRFAAENIVSLRSQLMDYLMQKYKVKIDYNLLERV